VQRVFPDAGGRVVNAETNAGATPAIADTPRKKDPFYRSSYAIKQEYEVGLKEVTRRLKLSLAEMLSMLADDPARAEMLLVEMAVDFRVKKASQPRPAQETARQRKMIQEKLRELDADTLNEILRLASRAGDPDQVK
jgi:hypothetical protein